MAQTRQKSEEPEDVGVTADRSGVIGLDRKGQKNKNKRPQPAKESSRERGGRQGRHCGEANPNQKLFLKSSANMFEKICKVTRPPERGDLPGKKHDKIKHVEK